jgi:MFS family permease
MVQEHSWRTGWQIIAGLSLVLAVLAAVTVRNRPSDLEQKPDGMLPEVTEHRSADATVTTASSDTWTLSAALRTPQFAVLCLCTVAFAIPWSVTTAHGRLHLEDLGLSTDVAAQILSVMILVSIAGRITGAAGDFLVPEKVLGFALLVEAAGMFGLLLATTATMAYVSTILVAVGFGAAYISTAVVVAKFFGRIAFAQILGAQYLISGIFNALSPAIAGWLFDSTGSYNIAFSTIGMMCVLGGILAFRLRVPQPPRPMNVDAATE